MKRTIIFSLLVIIPVQIECGDFMAVHGVQFGCTVGKDNVSGLFVYSYRVSNGTTTTQPITGVDIFIGRDTLTTQPFDSAGLNFALPFLRDEFNAAYTSGITSSWLLVGYPLLPRGWESSITSCIQFFTEDRPIGQGQSLDSLVVSSRGIPGIRAFSALPTFSVEGYPSIDSVDDPDSLLAESTSDRTGSIFSGLTVAPIAPSYPFVAVSFLDTMMRYERIADSIGWISYPDAARRFDGLLETAIQRAQARDFLGTQMILDTLISECELDSASALSSEAFSILFFDARYVLSQFRQFNVSTQSSPGGRIFDAGDPAYTPPDIAEEDSVVIDTFLAYQGSTGSLSIVPADGFHIDSIFINGAGYYPFHSHVLVTGHGTYNVPGPSRDAEFGYDFVDVEGDSSLTATFESDTTTYRVVLTSAPGGIVQSMSDSDEYNMHFPPPQFTDVSGLDTSYAVSYGVAINIGITPDSSFDVDSIVIDGVDFNPDSTALPPFIERSSHKPLKGSPASHASDASYLYPLVISFHSMWANHTVRVSFIAQCEQVTTIPDSGGTITPSSQCFSTSSNPTFTISPNAGFQLSDVLVDGVSVGAVTSYTFSNIRASHTIEARFTGE